MPERDPRVDAYIEKAAPFAQPILIRLRKLIFQACPDAVETIKWGFPNYEIYGSMFSNMAAFKEHCSFGFWKAGLLKDEAGILQIKNKNSMGHLDRLASEKDLPADKILIGYLKEAALLNKNNIKLSRPKAAPKKELPVPEPLMVLFKKNKKAFAGFQALTLSQRMEYIEWINEAKSEETIHKRAASTAEWAAEGKSRNWKYQRKA